MMGPQGCGKGTTGSMLAEYLHIPYVATGHMLRNISKEHPWYEEVNNSMNEGGLVDQKKVAVLLSEELKKDLYKDGFVLDGWYRRMDDVRAYEVPIDVALLLTISAQTTIKRLSTRRTCSKCGQIFNTITIVPKIEGICDKCGGTLIQRQDDTEEAILKRLEIYHEETKEVIEYIKSKGILKEINAEGTPEEVFVLAKQALDL